MEEEGLVVEELEEEELVVEELEEEEFVVEELKEEELAVEEFEEEGLVVDGGVRRETLVLTLFWTLWNFIYGHGLICWRRNIWRRDS